MTEKNKEEKNKKNEEEVKEFKEEDKEEIKNDDKEETNDSANDDEWLDETALDETESYQDVDDDDKNLKNIDPEKVEYTKIEDLRVGMDSVNVIGEIDFVGERRGSGYGSTIYVVGFIKDETGEAKTSFWDDDAIKAKPGKKMRIIHGNVTEYMGQLQLNPNKIRGVDFL